MADSTQSVYVHHNRIHKNKCCWLCWYIHKSHLIHMHNTILNKSDTFQTLPTCVSHWNVTPAQRKTLTLTGSILPMMTRPSLSNVLGLETATKCHVVLALNGTNPSSLVIGHKHERFWPAWRFRTNFNAVNIWCCQMDCGIDYIKSIYHASISYYLL